MFSLSFCVRVFRCGRSSLELSLSTFDARLGVPVVVSASIERNCGHLVVRMFGRSHLQSPDLGGFRVAGHSCLKGSQKHIRVLVGNSFPDRLKQF